MVIITINIQKTNRGYSRIFDEFQFPLQRVHCAYLKVKR